MNELQLKAHQSIEVTQIQQKKIFDKKVKKWEFKKYDIVMMFNAQHYYKVYKKMLPKWFWYFVIKKMIINNGSYEFENVDGSLYLDCINHDKLKKVLNMSFRGWNP